MEGPPTNPVHATETTLSILEAVAEAGRSRTTELADRVGVSKGTVHKHASTLVHHGYLHRRDDWYYPGLKLLNLGETARTRFPCYNRLEAAVRELHERTEEDVDFVVEEQGRVYTVRESYHKYEKRPDSSTGYRAHLGDQYYMHSVASGKALLSTYDRETVTAILERWGLPELTPNTITERDRLFEELAAVAERGYAIGDEEFQEGLRSVSRPVRLPDGTAFGALSVSGPAYRLTDALIEEEILAAHAAVLEDLEDVIADMRCG